MSIRVIGLGAGGHAKVLIEILQLNPQYELVGLLDRDSSTVGQKVLDVPIIGDDSLMDTLVRNGVSHFFVGLGSAGKLAPRVRLYEFARSQDLTPVSIIHPTAIVSPSAKLGAGITLLACSIVNASAQLGENVIVNSGAIVEHDCQIEDHVHIATGAKLAGTVHIGRCTHVGAGAVIRQGITVGQNVIVGLGAVVVRDVEDNVTVVGVPARPMKKTEH